MQVRPAIAAALAGAVLFGAIIAGFSNAQPGGGGEFSESEEDAIRDIVREYLIDHPEVLVDALNAYAERERAIAAEQAKDFARKNLSSLLDDRYSVTVGANRAAAKVAVIEFFDYHCGFCKRASGYIKDLTVKDPAVEVVFRELPILRRESDFAAEFAFAARKQGKYAELHFALMAENGVMTADRIKKVARKVGIDVAAVEAELKNPDIKKALDETNRLAAGMAVDGTPTFVIASLDGEFVDVVQGNRQEDIIAAIAEAKKAARK